MTRTAQTGKTRTCVRSMPWECPGDDEWSRVLAHRAVLGPDRQGLASPAVLESAGLSPRVVARVLADRGRTLRAAYVRGGGLEPWGGLAAVPLLLMELSAAAEADGIANSGMHARVLRQLAEEHSVVRLAQAYGVSRQAIHKRMHAEPVPLWVIASSAGLGDQRENDGDADVEGMSAADGAVVPDEETV